MLDFIAEAGMLKRVRRSGWWLLGIKDAETVDKVAAWIRQTEHHMECPADADSDLLFFLDFDLEILGASDWSRYLAYAQGVRQEYIHFKEEDYRKGRSLVLQRFLEKEHLFFTDEFRKACEAQAKENMRRELKSL